MWTNSKIRLLSHTHTHKMHTNTLIKLRKAGDWESVHSAKVFKCNIDTVFNENTARVSYQDIFRFHPFYYSMKIERAELMRSFCQDEKINAI